MVFKGRIFLISLRVVLLFLSLGVANYLLFFTHYRISAAIVCVLVLLQFLELLRYLQSERKHFERFFSALLHNDFTYHIPEKSLPGRENSWQHFANELLKKIQTLQLEKHEKHLLLQLITENAGAGILVFDEQGEIFLMNNETKRLLGAAHVHHLEALNHYAENLSQKLSSLEAGNKTIFKLIKNNAYLQLMVAAQKFKQQEKTYTLLTLQHIGAELEEQEILAWQKLTSVLSHEIMNSLTPVISLANSANMMLHKILADENKSPKNEDLQDIQFALNTIEKRSHAMLYFVQAYRKINKIPVPEFQTVSISSLLENALDSVENKLKDRKIYVRNKLTDNQLQLNVLADPDLLHQVLLNLFINSIHALENAENPQIEIQISNENQSQIILLISDNGIGIPDESRDKIFIPFFSTKQEGSGVGLSICKQITQAHGGDIYLLPKEISGERTTFALRLQKV
ncbi:MAG: GHKL domain-containing protein [Sphingobacteriales bacterium]|nr:MAG: GHKL domain-containing protein [Sphingobacteriales bacterium]